MPCQGHGRRSWPKGSARGRSQSCRTGVADGQMSDDLPLPRSTLRSGLCVLVWSKACRHRGRRSATLDAEGGDVLPIRLRFSVQQWAGRLAIRRCAIEGTSSPTGASDRAVKRAMTDRQQDSRGRRPAHTAATPRSMRRTRARSTGCCAEKGARRFALAVPTSPTTRRAMPQASAMSGSPMTRASNSTAESGDPMGRAVEESDGHRRGALVRFRRHEPSSAPMPQ
jgi:hypothetical protein